MVSRSNGFDTNGFDTGIVVDVLTHVEVFALPTSGGPNANCSTVDGITMCNAGSFDIRARNLGIVVCGGKLDSYQTLCCGNERK